MFITFYRIQHYLHSMNPEEALELLRRYPEQIIIYDPCGKTHLHTAAFKNLSTVVKYLIDNGSRVNIPDMHGNTPIILAMKSVIDSAWPRNYDSVEYLLDAGADLAHKNHAGWNSLRIFMKILDIKLGEMLLKVIRRCDVSDVTVAALLYDANWPLDIVLWLKRPAITRLMIDMGSNVNRRNDCDRTALHLAAIEADCVHINLLLDRGANIDALDVDGNSPLHCALRYNQQESHLEVVKALLDRKARCTDDDVFRAFKQGSPRIIERVLAHVNFDFERTNPKKKSVLHYAACNPDTRVMDMVVLSNTVTDWDQRTEMNCNALHFAAKKANPGVVELLIKKGTNILAKDNTGLPPLIYAIDAYLTCTTAAEKQRQVKVFELLVRFGADVDEYLVKQVAGIDGTALHNAWELENESMIKILLERIALREMMGMKPHDSNIDIIQSESDMLTYYESCRNELEKMKACILCDGIDMLRILNGSTRDFEKWTKDDVLVDAFFERISDFPIYGSRPNEKFSDVMEEKRVREIACKFASQYNNCSRNLMEIDVK